MTLKTIALALLLTLSSLAVACPNGSYNVEGWNPGLQPTGKPSYRGSVTISTVGMVCQLHWSISQQTFTGVGFYYPDQKLLTVAYANSKEGWFGIVNYAIVNDRKMVGTWAVADETTGNTGTEILSR